MKKVSFTLLLSLLVLVTTSSNIAMAKKTAESDNLTNTTTESAGVGGATQSGLNTNNPKAQEIINENSKDDLFSDNSDGENLKAEETANSDEASTDETPTGTDSDDAKPCPTVSNPDDTTIEMAEPDEDLEE